MRGFLLNIVIALRSSIKRWRYFILPNIFTRVDYTYDTTPICQQITEITGRGKIRIGKNCGFGYRVGGFWRNGSVELQARFKNAEILIGDRVHTNNNIFICAANKITIGNFTRIGQNVTLMDFEAHGTDPLLRSKIGSVGSIVIGENVWIGNNVTILKNTVIGRNTIVATGAVVSGVFPENVIIGGVPARIIKNL